MRHGISADGRLDGVYPLFGIDFVIGLVHELLVGVVCGDLEADVAPLSLAKMLNLDGGALQVEGAAGSTGGRSIGIAQHPVVEDAAVALAGLVEEQPLRNDPLQLSVFGGPLQGQVSSGQVRIRTIDDQLVGEGDRLLGLVLVLTRSLTLADLVELLMWLLVRGTRNRLVDGAAIQGTAAAQINVFPRGGHCN